MASDASPKSAISDVENDEANENHRVPEPDESTNCSNIEPVCNFKISSSFDASVDLDNNDLNYDDFDERSPDRLFGQDNSSSGAKDGVLDEATAISSSDESNQLFEPDTKSSIAECDKMPTDNEEMEVEDLEEGEILSDSDDAIPELKGGISPKNLDVQLQPQIINKPKPMPVIITALRASNRTNALPCKFFLRGSCTWGESCKYYHPPGALLRPQSSYMPITHTMADNNGLVVTTHRLPILPPAPTTTMVMPMPLLSVITQPPPLPPPPPMPTKQETSAWERGLRQARELITNKRNCVQQIEFLNKNENSRIPKDVELEPINSPESLTDIQLPNKTDGGSETLKELNNTLDENGLAEGSGADSPVLMTEYPPELLISSKCHQEQDQTAKKSHTDADEERHQRVRISSETRSKPNRSALGSSNSKYSDPWARNPSMRKPASSPNSNYGNRRSTQKRRHKSRSSSSSSSRPTIPDDVDYDSERFKSYRSRDKLAKRDSKDDRRDRGDKNRHANSRRNSTRSMSQSSSYSSEIRKAGSKRRNDPLLAEKGSKNFTCTTLRSLVDKPGSTRTKSDKTGQKKRQSGEKSPSSSSTNRSSPPPKHSRFYAESSSKAKFHPRNSGRNAVNKFLEKCEQDVPAVYRIDDNHKSGMRRRRRDSSSEHSSSCSSESDSSKKSSASSEKDHRVREDTKASDSRPKAHCTEDVSMPASNNSSEAKSPVKYKLRPISPELSTEIVTSSLQTSIVTIESSDGKGQLSKTVNSSSADKIRKREELMRELKSIDDLIAKAASNGRID